jgi:hypothetical protein
MNRGHLAHAFSLMIIAFTIPQIAAGPVLTSSSSCEIAEGTLNVLATKRIRAQPQRRFQCRHLRLAGSPPRPELAEGSVQRSHRVPGLRPQVTRSLSAREEGTRIARWVDDQHLPLESGAWAMLRETAFPGGFKQPMDLNATVEDLTRAVSQADKVGDQLGIEAQEGTPLRRLPSRTSRHLSVG